MKIIISKITSPVLTLVALTLFGAIVTTASATPSANGKIAFTSERDGNREIYIMNNDGTGQVRLTNNAGVDDYSAWSPDGKKIAYLSRIESGQYVIKIMNANGTGQQIVTPIVFDLSTSNFCGERFSLSWSPNSSKIVFQEFDNIVTVNVDGTNRQNITNTSISESEPSWGPAGLIAYAATLGEGDEVNGLDIRTTNGRIYAQYGYFTCSTSPDLSPDGTKLAYIHSNDFAPPGFITIISLYDFTWERAFNFSGVANVRWSPDGNFLALTSCQYPNPCNVEIVDEFGEGRRILTQGFNPSWQKLPPAACPNPIDCSDFFTRQHYFDFLNREPDPTGHADWQAILNNCPTGDTNCDRIHVSSAFFRSPEFQGRGYFVYRFYPLSFGRKPDYDEFAPDLAWVSGFLTDTELEAAKQAFIVDFMNRPAFVSKFNGLSNTEYVDSLLLTAGITHSSRDFWIAALTSSSRTRAQVLREIAESSQVYDKYYNQAFVVMQYFGYLRRQPDALYLNWIAHLDATGDYRSMIHGFVNSLEYRARFGP